MVVLSNDCLLFFFFKQKTAYEMRISDWSSDVCSSDLCFGGCDPNIDALAHELGPQGRALLALVTNRDAARVPSLIAALPEAVQEQMGRLSLANRDLAPLAGRLILVHGRRDPLIPSRSEEHTSELQSLMRNSYAVF